ncbi:tudor domain-containing 6 isoform X2 [Triplophysa dalaica]|uniref:tudor domain-containing 6 isoform X2 n=1 Tax=Triplophysa dalaica TaxID=1582913 RepID=UPI0024DF843C|nr:tudor domain-containing 6 isoform X2 [Triplophysa dalaica]
MYSVPGLPDVGSDVTFRVTRVNLTPHNVLVEFGGNLSDVPETAELYQHIKEEIDVETAKKDSFEGKPGDVCYMYDDKTWHRARILSKSEHEYNVFLIDQGKIFSASGNVLEKCPPNLLDHPPTVEHCVLGNASPLCEKSGWSEAASEFIRSLCGKSISGCVQDVMMPYRILILDVPNVSKEMIELGFARKISDDNFKSLVTSSLHSTNRNATTRTDILIPGAEDPPVDSETLYQYFYPELLAGTIEIVTVTHVVHPLTIFCKLDVFSQELKKLSDQLHKCNEDLLPSLMSQPLFDGSPCAAKGSDGRWHRSVHQESIVSDVVKVFHVDYGIGDFVKLRNIRPLSPRFFQLPVVTFACSLHGIADKGIGWRTDQIDFLKSIVLDQVFIGKFEQLREGVYDITLYGKDNVNVNKVFGHKEECLSVAERMCDADQTLETLKKVTYRSLNESLPVCTNCSTGPCEDFATASERQESLNDAVSGFLIHRDAYEISPPQIDVGTKEKVWITSVLSVNQFYGHFAQNIDTVRKMTSDIEQLCCKQTRTTFSVSPKMMCFAKYPDGHWHRGQIESTHPQIFVRFVDYGKLLVLDKSEILPITPEASAVASIPIQAVEFELFNVTLPQSSELNEWFENYATDGMFSITVMKKNPLGKLSVEMHDEKTNLNLKMKEKLNQAKWLNQEANKIGACKVFSEVMESERLKEHLSVTTQAHEKICRKETKPVIQTKQKCNFPPMSGDTTGHNDSQQHKMMCHYPKLTDLPSKALAEGYVTEVYLSHCNSPSNFYLHLKSEEDQILSILNELNCSQLSSAQVDLHVLQPGDVVQAEYPSDGAWYRAVVQNKDEDNVHVQYIDFGNEATLTPLQIRQLEKRFLNTPLLSVHCSHEGEMSGGKRDWTKEEVMAFKKAAGEYGKKKVLCRFIRHDGSAWLVRLEHQGVVLEWPFFDVSRFQTGSQMIFTNEHILPLTFKEPALKERQTVEAYASSICGPNYFWCQFKNSEELDKISLIAQEVGNVTQTKPILLEQLFQGVLCLARFSDELWYRAQVIHKLANAVSVVFIDYGNESEIDLNFVKSLSHELLERPPQAFLCQLGGFKSSHGMWSDVASDTFYELLVDEPLNVTIQNTVMSSDFPKCPQYNVAVECKGLLVNDLMKDYWCDLKPQLCCQGTKAKTIESVQKDDIAKADLIQFERKDVNAQKVFKQHLPQATSLPSRVVERGMVSEVYISNITSLRNFFVQLAEDEDTLFSLNEQLNSSRISEADVIHECSVQKGSLVKAVFPEDGCWYRAVVKGTTENDLIQVEFIDFGNEAIVSRSNICRLDKQLLSYPRFSIRCSSNIEDRFKNQKGEEAAFLLKKMFGQAGENKLSCKFIKEDTITWEVEMALNGSMADSLLGEKWDDSDLKGLLICSKQMSSFIPVKEKQMPFKKPNVSLGQMVEAFASCIVGPNYFWCQFANSGQLDQIYLAAQEYGNSTETQQIQMDRLGPGSPCWARFPDDLMWYRAQVIKKCNNSVSVLFIDFGNESDIHASSLKALPSKLLETPPQAFLCQLEGFAPSEGSWDDRAADHFHKLLVDRPLKVTVNGIENTVDPNIPPYYVKIEVQQCSIVNELMKNFWRASVRRDVHPTEISSENVASTSVDSQMSETHCVPLNENHKGIFESVDGVPVGSVKQALSHTEESREDTEDIDALATMSRSRSWAAGLESRTFLMLGTEEYCDSIK